MSRREGHFVNPPRGALWLLRLGITIAPCRDHRFSLVCTLSLTSARLLGSPAGTAPRRTGR
eukprot:2745233-Pyramimonas_sp.AAC.2